MSRRNGERDPYYRLLPKGHTTPNLHPKCVIAGPNRRAAVLYIHSSHPDMLPLTPQLVAFLRDALVDLPTSKQIPVD